MGFSDDAAAENPKQSVPLLMGAEKVRAGTKKAVSALKRHERTM